MFGSSNEINEVVLMQRKEEDMHTLSTVERRALDRVSTDKGRLLIVAADQRNSMKATMVRRGADPKEVSNEALLDAKFDIVTYLGNKAPAILLDPEVSVPDVIDRSVLSPKTALVVGMDASGYEERNGLRYTRMVAGCSPSSLRELGADCAKMLWYMRSDRQDESSELFEEMTALIREAHESGLLLIVEILTYRLAGESPEEYEANFPELIRGAAELSVKAGARVLKLPYPGSAAACTAVTRAAGDVPWAVLSAGVDHEVFLTQVETAVNNGASGAMAGRSLWKDALAMSHDERAKKLTDVSAPRLRELQNAVDR